MLKAAPVRGASLRDAGLGADVFSAAAATGLGRALPPTGVISRFFVSP